MEQSANKNEAGQSIPLKCYTSTQLAEIYEVCPKTFRKWLKPFKAEIGVRVGFFYSIKQVAIIFEHLGVPGRMLLDE